MRRSRSHDIAVSFGHRCSDDVRSRRGDGFRRRGSKNGRAYRIDTGPDGESSRERAGDAGNGHVLHPFTTGPHGEASAGDGSSHEHVDVAGKKGSGNIRENEAAGQSRGPSEAIPGGLRF